MDAVESFDVGPLTVDIVVDQDPMDPREWDNLGVMLCSHRDYTLGDVQGTAEDIPEDAISVLPLYLFDHSGLAMRTDPSGFAAADSAGWDWGQVGVIYATPETVAMCGTSPEHITEALVNEVSTYDDYLQGNVYGYVVKDDDGNVLDSCWGFFPDASASDDVFGLNFVRMEATDAAENTDEYRRWEVVSAAELEGVGL